MGNLADQASLDSGMTVTNHPIQPEVNAVVYRPEGMPEWKVGMRVQVRISGECDVLLSGNYVNGKVGTIIRADYDHPTHIYVVQMDESFTDRNAVCWKMLAAASELILVSDEGRER